MRIIILSVIFVLIGTFSFAETYLIIDSNTKEVKSLSPEDDAQLEPGWEKIILPEDFDTIELTHQPVYYKYAGKKFVTNTKKLDDEYQAALLIEEIAQEKKEVMNKLIDMGIEALEIEGKVFKYKDKLKEE